MIARKQLGDVDKHEKVINTLIEISTSYPLLPPALVSYDPCDSRNQLTSTNHDGVLTGGNFNICPFLVLQEWYV
jgi:hypothetical protein